MWDVKEINKKKQNIIKRIKNCKDPLEKDKLFLTLASYIGILDNSGTIRYTKFYNLLDKVTNDHFTLNKPSSKLVLKGESVITKQKNFMDENYLMFLLKLTYNVSKTESLLGEVWQIQYKEFKYSSDVLIEISKMFYSTLEDKELYHYARKILDDSTSLNFSSSFSTDYKRIKGITFYDYMDNKVYCTTRINHTLFDLQANNHEIMHGIDFYMQPKIPTEDYYGFHEGSTYTIDYLFLDYLESIGIDREEVQKLRVYKDAYLQSLANRIILEIKTELIKQKGISYLRKHSIKDILEILNPLILKDLLELESGIIAYGLNKQLNESYELGLQNLKNFMKTSIPKSLKPDFSNIGLSDDCLSSLSLEIGSYSRNYQIRNDMRK